ncbi:tyrosine protein phosphatase [Paenibacillus sp. sptzw28]|uniref:tyrosine-protein phosphatase n=1 Tax=Paenibacillus sp. sptzw28 TaxID=715179 RepID=UPI001C6EB59E|nr:CpsB/CapC family capsule biosynthesis tyrosine phosphatase [Paenibacillus sp. sptzw28]QYR20630.1 tyrosine protein phosphatase [Paenibacillus sp. sptzw28]
MIEIHCHILPLVDDGARTKAEALEMARIAVMQGIDTIIATPHHANGAYENPSNSIRQAVLAFNDSLIEEGIPLTVHTGQEIRVYQELIEEWERGNLCTLAGSRYILLELPSSHIPRYLGDIIHEFIIRGLVPVIAHPERNAEIITSPHLLIPYIHQGALCQLTAQSVAGLFGRQIRKQSLKLCRSKMIHFIASDAHNCFRRTFFLQEAYQNISAALGEEYVQMYQSNAGHILRNNEIICYEPIPPRKKLLFW